MRIRTAIVVVPLVLGIFALAAVTAWKLILSAPQSNRALSDMPESKRSRRPNSPLARDVAPALETLRRVKIHDYAVFIPPGIEERMRRPLEDLARWQIAIDPECADTSNVTFGNDPRLIFIDCSPPCSSTATNKNVFYSVEQVLELSRLIEEGHVPDVSRPSATDNRV